MNYYFLHLYVIFNTFLFQDKFYMDEIYPNKTRHKELLNLVEL